MSYYNEHKVSLKIYFGEINLEIEESGYTYQSVNDQLRNDLDNITDNAIKLIAKAKGEGEEK